MPYTGAGSGRNHIMTPEDCQAFTIRLDACAPSQNRRLFIEANISGEASWAYEVKP